MLWIYILYKVSCAEQETILFCTFWRKYEWYFPVEKSLLCSLGVVMWLLSCFEWFLACCHVVAVVFWLVARWLLYILIHSWVLPSVEVYASCTVLLSTRQKSPSTVQHRAQIVSAFNIIQHNSKSVYIPVEHKRIYSEKCLMIFLFIQ